MSEPMTNRCYLGDSVYADFDGWHVVLTTDNGFGATPAGRQLLPHLHLQQVR